MPTSARAPPIGLPTFCDSMRASSSTFSSTSVATRRIRRARSVGENARQAGNAAFARATAASVSSTPASGSCTIVCSVAGLTTAGTASFEHVAAPARRRAELVLLVLDDPDGVALGVREQPERDHLHLGHGHDGLPAELLRLVEHGLRVIRGDVERDVILTVRRLADTRADTSALRVVRPVRHVTGDLLDLPAEQVSVEALELLAVLPDDLDPGDLVRHHVLLPEVGFQPKTNEPCQIRQRRIGGCGT